MADTNENTGSGGFPFQAVAGGLLDAYGSYNTKIPKAPAMGIAYDYDSDVPQFNEQGAFNALRQASDAATARTNAIGGGIGSAVGSVGGFLLGGPVGSTLGGAVGDFIGRGIGSLFGDGGEKARMQQQISDERRYAREAANRSAMAQQQKALEAYNVGQMQKNQAKVKPYSLSNFMEF